jgi:hypothetical protein
MWLNVINSYLSLIGVYILIIPASILLTSLLTTEFKVINGLAALCGVTGTLLVVVRVFILGKFNEYLNLTIFNVYNTAVWESKVYDFQIEIDYFIGRLTNPQEHIFYAQLFKHTFEQYKQEIIKIPSEEITSFSLKVITEMKLKYAEHLAEISQQISVKKPWGFTEALVNVASYITLKGVVYTVGTIVVVGVIYFGITRLGAAISTDTPMEMGQKAGSALQEAAANFTRVQSTVNSLSSELLESIQTQQAAVAKETTKILVQGVTTLLDTSVVETIVALKSQVEDHAKIIAKLIEDVKKK